MPARKNARRRSLRNPEPPILYPDGMRPVRAPFIIGAEYRFDNFVEGVYVLRRLTINAANKWATLGVDGVDETWRRNGVRDEDEFFAMKPHIVRVDRQRVAYDLQDVYVPIDDPGDDLRDIVSRSAELFARITGTKKVSLGRTKASVAAARKQLMRDVRAFAEVNRIDPYEGRAL